MIILDTNIVSESMKIGRNPAVVEWLDEQLAETLYLTATSLSELLIGIAVLPQGKRKERLNTQLGNLLVRLFGSRILPFDQKAAITYGKLVSTARLAGKIISMPDGQIGAIAHIHGLAVATRDTAPFDAMGIPVINPFLH